jgi:hypothetical protein
LAPYRKMLRHVKEHFEILKRSSIRQNSISFASSSCFVTR